MLTALAVFAPGLPSAPSTSTYHASPDPSSPLTSIQQPVQAETNGFITTNSSTYYTAAQALHKQSSFFKSFALTPCHCYQSDPLEEALHLRPWNIYYDKPITFASPYPFPSATSGTSPDPSMNPTNATRAPWQSNAFQFPMRAFLLLQDTPLYHSTSYQASSSLSAALASELLTDMLI
jgi:hypothetical protein